MKSGKPDMDLVSRYLDGQATEEEVARLDILMRENPQLRADFLAYARLNASLPGVLTGNTGLPVHVETNSTKERFSWIPPGIAATLAIIAIGLSWKANLPKEVIGHFVKLEDCRWMDETKRVQKGDNLTAGQRIELLAGSVEVLFDTGARLQLFGPVIAQLKDGESLFLSVGETRLVAETQESKGFTIITPSTKFVDISTAFTATVSPDGLSRLDVSEGEVDVVLGGKAINQRLKAGEALYVEPGEKKILTRIEPGDGSQSFLFPTIPPPSREDYADQSQGHAQPRAFGELGKGADLRTLLDGKGQSKQDSPRQSVHFPHRIGGNLLIDLGKTIQIARVNSYSWHQHNDIPQHRERARQKFTIYGYAGDKHPQVSPDLQASGWQRIARVNSDSFFHVRERMDRPAQQACSISAAEGNIGLFRYLLWEIGSGTFFGEIDVFDAESNRKHIPTHHIPN